MINTPENLRLLQDVLRKEAPALLRKRNVRDARVGLKLTDGEATPSLCIQVLVSEKQPLDQIAAQDVVRVPGYPTDVIEVGRGDSVRRTTAGEDDCPTKGTAWKRDERYATLSGGINVKKEGAPRQATLGMFVYDALEPYPSRHLIGTARAIASAATKNSYENVYVVQGGNGAEDRIAEVTRSVYRRSTTPGLTAVDLDVAIARLIPSDREVDAGIAEIDGFEPMIMEPRLGMIVAKSGARTGLTTGVIHCIQRDTIYFRAKSDTGPGDELIVCGGDFGSILLGKTPDDRWRPVGLVIDLFARDRDGLRTCWGVATRMSTIVEVAKIRLEPPSGWLHRYRNETLGRTVHAPPDMLPLRGLHADYEYVRPAFGSLPRDGQDVAPLYCFYNSSRRSHFYSTDRRGEGKIKLGYVFAGEVGRLSLSAGEGLSPLRRYFDPARQDYTLALDEEKDEILASGYELDTGSMEHPSGATLPKEIVRSPTGWPVVWAMTPKQIVDLSNAPAAVVDTGKKRTTFAEELYREVAAKYKGHTFGGKLVVDQRGRFTEWARVKLDKRHVFGDREARRLIHRILNSLETRGAQFDVLSSLGFTPDNYSPEAINDAAKRWRKSIFNDINNVFLGGKKENNRLGRAFGKLRNLLETLDLGYKTPETRVRLVRRFVRSRPPARALAAFGGLLELLTQLGELAFSVAQHVEMSSEEDERNDRLTMDLFAWWMERGTWPDTEDGRIVGLPQDAMSLAHSSIKNVSTPAAFYAATQIDPPWYTEAEDDPRPERQAIDYQGGSIKALLWVDGGLLGHSQYKLVSPAPELTADLATGFQRLHKNLDQSRRTEAGIKQYSLSEFSVLSARRWPIFGLPTSGVFSFRVVVPDFSLGERKFIWAEPLDMIVWERSHRVRWPKSDPLRPTRFLDILGGGWAQRPNPYGYVFLERKLE